MSQEKAAEIIDFSATLGEGGSEGVRSRGADSSPGSFPRERETAGAFLAAARCDAGLSLAAISDVIKVKTSHLEAIEATRPDLLPAAPYATGFVKVYARALGLDAEALARQFREDIGAAAPAQLIFADAPPAAQTSPSFLEGARLVSVFAVIAVVAFVFWIASQILSGGPAQQVPAVAEGAPRAFDVPPFTPREGVATAPAGTDAAAARAPLAAQPSAAQAAAPAPSGAPAGQPGDAAAGPLPRLKPAVVAASLSSSVAPAYPEPCAAGAAPLETVTVLFDIAVDGRPENARVIASSNACFEDAALAALSQWRFSPRMVGGAPAVAAGKRATLNFRA